MAASGLSGVGVTIGCVEVSAQMVSAIPRGNIRVPREEFAALWRAAERAQETNNTWRGGGVTMTCRWLARATVRPAEGRPYMARSPVTARAVLAMAELIQAELLEAEKLALRRPVPGQVLDRPGWLDAVIATLNWAWLGRGEPPVRFLSATARTG